MSFSCLGYFLLTPIFHHCHLQNKEARFISSSVMLHFIQHCCWVSEFHTYSLELDSAIIHICNLSTNLKIPNLQVHSVFLFSLMTFVQTCILPQGILLMPGKQWHQSQLHNYRHCYHYCRDKLPYLLSNHACTLVMKCSQIQWWQIAATKCKERTAHKQDNEDPPAIHNSHTLTDNKQQILYLLIRSTYTIIITTTTVNSKYHDLHNGTQKNQYYLYNRLAPKWGRIMAVLVLKSITSHLLCVVTLKNPVNKHKVSAWNRAYQTSRP